MTDRVDPTREGFAHCREPQREGPVHMLNLLHLRAVAANQDGTVATGAEAHRSDARASGPILARLGGRQVWLGLPELILIGPAEEHCDLAVAGQERHAAGASRPVAG